MKCSLSDLRNKEVIDVKTGEKLGFVDDVEISTDTATVESLIIYGRPRMMGVLGREDDIVIKCRDIQLIGDDTILVKNTKSDIFAKSYTLKCESL